MHMPDPILLLTRPDRASRGLLKALSDAGIRAKTSIISPLIEIVYAGRLPKMQAYRGLIFTSAHGVEAYRRAGGPHRSVCFAVGTATAQAARQAGFHPVTGDGDAERLIAEILALQTEGPLLHLRGRHGRGDVARRLTLGGIETDEIVLYDQVAKDMSTEAQTALSGNQPVVAPLFSPRTAELFAASGPMTCPLYLAAMSDAVADPLRKLDTKALMVSDEPSVPAMRRAVAELLSRAQELESRGGGK